jgi:hypothetical protein
VATSKRKRAPAYPARLLIPEPTVAQELRGITGPTQEVVAELARRRVERVMAKAAELMAFLGVPECYSEKDKWKMLALELAQRHIAGFQEREPAGAPKRWSDTKRAELRLAVDAIVERNNPNKGIRWACEQLARKKPWSDEVKGARPAEALRKQYQLADPALAAYLEFQRDASPNRLAALRRLAEHSEKKRAKK